MSRCHSFAPVAQADARVLILGSMPGVASLQANQYYAHPQNAFWRIQWALWDAPATRDYACRLALLADHRIALWDVAADCRREGSLDARMRDITINDFAWLFTVATGVDQVFCNGGTAYGLYMRHVQPHFAHIHVTRLPSTSPAHTLSFEQKLAAWQVIKEALT